MPLLVHQHLRRHAAHLEQLDLLAIQLQDRVLGIGQTDEGQVVLLPVTGEGIRPLRAHHDDHRADLLELAVVMAQSRHVRAAERSGEAPVEHQHHVFLSLAGRTAGSPRLGSPSGRIRELMASILTSGMRVSDRGRRTGSARLRCYHMRRPADTSPARTPPPVRQDSPPRLHRARYRVDYPRHCRSHLIHGSVSGGKEARYGFHHRGAANSSRR